MDIVITTSDPDNVNVDEIRRLLEAIGYFVNTIEIVDRGL